MKCEDKFKEKLMKLNTFLRQKSIIEAEKVAHKITCQKIQIKLNLKKHSIRLSSLKGASFI
jgi:hypothetical protein